MPNQKGSVKDRLRARFRFLQYKKIKKKQEKQFLKRQKELEKERIKAEQIRLYGRSYNKVQVFGYALLGLLIGIFTPKSSPKKIINELNDIQKNMDDIVLALEQDQNIQIVYDKIDRTYQELDDLKKNHQTRLVADSFRPTRENSWLKVIDEKQKELEIFNQICHKREKQSSNDIHSKNFANNGSNNKLSPMRHVVGIAKKEEMNYSNQSLETKALFKEENKENAQDQAITLEPLKGVKKMNEDLKEYNKQLERLEEQVKEQNSYAGLYDCEFKLKQLKMRISKILEEYELLKEQFNLEKLEEVIDIDVIDKYELRKDETKVIVKIEKCENLLQVIEIKKANLGVSIKNVSSKETVVEEDKKEKVKEEQQIKQEEKKKEEKEKLEEQFEDIYLANKMIVDQIVKEKRAIDKLKRQLYRQPVPVRKRSVFFYAKRFTTSILNFGFSFLPFKYFRNRMLGTFVTGVMLNNSIRSVRRIFSTDEQEIGYLFYQDMLKQIRTNQDYIYHLTKVCSDSLVQISEIKTHLALHYSMIREYDAPLTEFYNELEQLEGQLTSQLEDLQRTNKSYEEVKQKVKIRD